MSCNQPGCPSLRSEALILTDNEAERDRWIATLEELQKAAKQTSNQIVSTPNRAYNYNNCHLVISVGYYKLQYSRVFFFEGIKFCEQAQTPLLQILISCIAFHLDHTYGTGII